MLKKLLSIVLAGLLINILISTSARAASGDDKQARFITQVKENIARLGTGVEARVKVKLRDKTRLEGYVSEANPDSFVIIDAKTNTPVTVAYAQVKGVKGQNVSTGAKIAIGIGIGVGALVVLLLVFKDRIEGH